MSHEEKSGAKASSLLNQWRSRKKTGTRKTIPLRSAGQVLLPSHGQQRLWLLQKLYPDNPFYQYAHLYKINGLLDADILTQSFQFLIDRHEILRSNFVEKDDLLQMKINSPVSFSLRHFDLSETDAAEQEAKATKLVRQEANRLFDLSEDRLIRVSLLKLAEDSHRMVLSMHHTIGDRASLLVLNQELFTVYQALQKGQPPELPELAIQYADYALWQRAQETRVEDKEYWLNKLSGDLSPLSLPFDFQRPRQPGFRGKTLTAKLTSTLSSRLDQLAKSCDTTLYVLMLAAFKLLLYRYTQQEDLLVGSPFSTRDRSELERGIGFFNETLVLRSQLTDQMTFKELVSLVKTATLEAFEHKNMPFDELVRELKPARYGSANPLFQTMFLFNRAATLATVPELEIEEATIDLKASKFDLTLFVTEQPEQLELTFEYAVELFKEATIVRMLESLEVILQSVTDQSGKPLSQIPVMSEAVRHQILYEWNEGKQALPAEPAIHHLIEEMARQYPDRDAVIYEEEKLTYAELNQRADRLADGLKAAGVSANQAVGLFMGRSVDTLSGMLAILKAGAGYLPLDPEYPAERIDYMIRDAEASFVLTNEALKAQLTAAGTRVLIIESILESANTSTRPAELFDTESLAYLIYTSGSTGHPKGVPISHKNLLHSTSARFTFFPGNPTCFLLLSSFSFDSSVAGIFWTLCSGGTLLLPRRRIEQDVYGLSELISAHRVTHSLMLPSLYAAILDYAAAQQLQTLENVMVAGEACLPGLVAKHFAKLPSVALYNEYGPTEATVWCIAHRIEARDTGFVPIGKPIPNATAYLLDAHLHPVPVGVAGELYIGGPGLSKGYLNRPELTAERFLPHPFYPDSDERIYKTGDRARYHPDGRIEFLGRADEQVKIRGFRVEPDEIRKVLLQYPAVEEALVIVHQSQDKPARLIAYASGLSKEEIPAAVKFMAEKLPDYMLPSALIPLTDFPRLPNGKINRKLLPDPGSHYSLREKSREPRNDLEKTLIAVWEETLKVKPIGIDDNFFAIGGDSILSIQLVARARRAGIILAPNQLFEYQTIAQLSESMEEEEKSPSLTSVSEENPPMEELLSYPLSYLQKAFLFNSQRTGKDQGLLQLEFSIAGPIDYELFQKAWQLSVQGHPVMRTHLRTEAGKAPLQQIEQTATLPWTLFDWQEKGAEERALALQELLEKDEDVPLPLDAAPVSRMHLIRLKKEEYLLLWTCHHLFLDGWSCGIILQDALSNYEALNRQSRLELAPLPNYLAYLQWQDQQDRSGAEEFWKEELSGFNHALLFASEKNPLSGEATFADEVLQLDDQESRELRQYCRQQRISLSTLFQGAWAILLSRFFQTDDVLFGVTVSGRFANFRNIESISGLFMNIVPNRFAVIEDQQLESCLQQLQKKQGLIGKYENLPLESIRNLIGWPAYLELFDILFVFGNFLKNNLKTGPLEVTRFRGGYSSAFPLTIRVNPLDCIEIDWRYDNSRLEKSQLEWIRKEFHRLLRQIAEVGHRATLGSITQSIAEPQFRPALIDLSKAGDRHQTETTKQNYVAPTTPEEAQLCRIWEELFDRKRIGTDDHFFELGGRSLLAIQLFSRIEQEMGVVLPPSVLLQHPTVAEIASLLRRSESQEKERFLLVPLKTGGTSLPLFCIHGGGAHVFFYQPLAKALPEDQPVYSIQAPDLKEGQDAAIDSIEKMAARYIEEIREVQPEGPYQLLGTCFSNAVSLEMARQLKAASEEVAFLAIIDSGPVHLFGDTADGKSKTLRRFLDLLKRGEFSLIRRKLNSRWGRSPKKEPLVKKEEGSAQKRLRETIEALNKMYAIYQWKAFEGKIHFIRSSEFHHRADKKYQLQRWTRLAAEGLEVKVVDGHHISLFEQPEVQGLAAQLAECLKSVRVSSEKAQA